MKNTLYMQTVLQHTKLVFVGAKPFKLKGVKPVLAINRSMGPRKVQFFPHGNDLFLSIQDVWAKGDRRTVWFVVPNYRWYRAVDVDPCGWLGTEFVDVVFKFWHSQGLSLVNYRMTH